MKSLVAVYTDFIKRRATHTRGANAPSKKCRSRIVGHRRKIQFTQSLLNREFNPATAAEVLLVLGGRLSAAAVAARLRIPLNQATELLIEGHCRKRFGSKSQQQNH